MKLGIVVALVVVAGACGSDGDPNTPVAGDLLITGTSSGVSALDPKDGRVAYRIPGGVLSPDGSQTFAAVPSAVGTRLTAHSPTTGQPTWSRELSGERLAVRTVGAGSRLVALTPAEGSGGSPYSPVSRAQTTLVVAAADTPHSRTYNIEGNIEPEAFSTDGTALFVIHYSPPLAPDRYRVRRLDLSTGELGDVYSPDKHLQEDMRGTARTQVMAPDGSRLYTLYTLETPGEEPLGFVHVLNLTEQWAHCVDLPDGIATGPEGTSALAVSSSGGLFVADAQLGRVAKIDTQALRVARAVRAPVPSAPVADAIGDQLFIGGQNQLIALDGDLRERHTWPLAGQATDLRTALGNRLYVGFMDGVEVLDAGSGRQVRRMTVPGAERIIYLSSSKPTLVGRTRGLECAC